MDPVIGSSLISGAGSLFNGFLGLGGSNKAAKTQLQATRETNAMNYKIAQENNAFNEKMWNAQNEYNTPSAQKKRFEEAGLNPNLMMDGSSSGNASTSVTADTSGTQVAPDIGSTIASGYEQFGNSIAQGAQSIAQMNYGKALQDAQVKKVLADARSQDISNDFSVAMHVADLTHKNWLNKFSERNYDILKRTQDYIVDKLHADAANAWSQNALTERQCDLAYLQGQIASVEYQIQKENLKWLPQEKQANLAAVLQNTLTSASQMRMNDAAAKNYVAMTVLNYANANGINLDNDLKASVFDLSVGLVENQYNKGYFETEQTAGGWNLGLPSTLSWQSGISGREKLGKKPFGWSTPSGVGKGMPSKSSHITHKYTNSSNNKKH